MIRVLAILEADTLTGPAKNFLESCRYIQRSFTAAPPPVGFLVATFRRGAAAGIPDEFRDACREAGLRCFTVPESFRFDPRVLGWLKRIVRESEAQLIQTHSVKSHFLLRASGLWKRCPWIAFHHGYTWPNLRMRAYNQLDRWSLRKACRVVTVTAAFQRELEAAGVAPQRISIIGNAIAPDWIAGASQEGAKLRTALASGGERLLVSIGRLSAEKAHRDLLEAAALLRRSRPDLPLKLVLVGDGPERERLRQAGADLGLALELTGQVRDVRPYFAAADIFVLPSHSEGSPNVILEAMAAAVPIVATNVGGVPEMLAHERDALLAPPQQPAALAQALERLLDNPSLAGQLARSAGATLQRRYGQQARADRLIRLYQDVMQAGH